MYRKCLALLTAGGLLACLSLAAPADDKKDDKKEDKKPQADGGLVIIDAKGKENKIKSWEILKGTRRLAWLAPPEKKPEGEEDGGKAPPRRPAKVSPRGPEALAFRDLNASNWKDDVQTFVLLERLRGIDFDADKEEMTVKVAVTDKPDDDISLSGTTKFSSFNRLVIEAEVDKGEIGIAAVKYTGGAKEGGIKGIRFPSPKGAKAPEGRPAQVIVQRTKTEKGTEKVTDLVALYHTTEGEKALPTLLFRKTIKLDVSKLKKMKAGDANGEEWTLTLKNDQEETLTLLEKGEIDGKPVQLEGFLAKVPAGWKLFPLLTVVEIQFDEPKQP